MKEADEFELTVHESYMSYPFTIEECFDAAKSNEKDLCGFTKEELISRGASKEAIELLKEKYKLAKQYPHAELELARDENNEPAWIIDLSKGKPTESYRYEILDMSKAHTYKAPEKKEIEKSFGVIIDELL